MKCTRAAVEMGRGSEVRSRLLRILALVVSICGVTQAAAYACTCPQVTGIQAELDRSDVIFAGRAISVDSSLDSGQASFEVSSVWRGSVPRIIETSNVWDCMSVFRIGEEYLVFARRIDNGDGSGFRLVASQCGQTRPLKYSQEALDVLGLGSSPQEAETAETKAIRSVSLVAGALFLLVLMCMLARKLARRTQSQIQGHL
jgi:hypothetical protein